MPTSPLLHTICILITLGFALSSTPMPKPIKGPYSVESVTLENPALDKTDRRVLVTFPADAPSSRLVAYAHGLGNNADDYKGEMKEKNR